MDHFPFKRPPRHDSFMRWLGRERYGSSNGPEELSLVEETNNTNLVFKDLVH